MFTRQRSRWPFWILPASWRWKRYDDGEGQRATREGEKNEGFFASLRMTAQGYNSGNSNPTARQQVTGDSKDKAKGKEPKANAKGNATIMTTAKGKEQRKKAKRMRDSSLRSE